ncbi:PAS domain-containing protein [Alphaproteobacteria bacterium]|nr:PAS domain-containing protein [Alphaproteobacteria bacterium]
MSRVHALDVDRANAILGAYLSGVVAHFEIEHWVRHADDERRWMLMQGLAVRGADGTAYNIASSQTKITNRKRADQRAVHDDLHDSLTGWSSCFFFA